MQVEAIGLQYEIYICLYKNIQVFFFTPILIFIGYYLYIFIQVKFSMFVTYLLSLLSIIVQNCPCIIGLRLCPQSWTMTRTMVCLSLGLRPMSKLFPQRKKDAKGHSLLRGQKTPHVDWTYLLGEYAASLGSRFNPCALAQPLDYCSLLGFSGTQWWTRRLRAITRYLSVLRQTFKG